MNNKRMTPALVISAFLLITTNPVVALVAFFKNYWLLVIIGAIAFALNEILNNLPHKG